MGFRVVRTAGARENRPVSETRRATRPTETRLVGGVAAGLAEHLGVDVAWIRFLFIVTAWSHGAGIVAYLLLWRFMPLATATAAPGIEAASRFGLRPPARRSITEVVRTVGVIAIGVGFTGLVVVAGHRANLPVLVPTVVALGGLALIWRQFDDAHRVSFGWRAALRGVLGVGLIAAAATYFLTVERGLSAAVDLALATAVAVAGLALVLGPWVYGLVGDLASERRERVRSQDRADVAAHLHDSVLQTLALLQKNAADPAAVATLARRQERELRDWMYGTEQPPQGALAGALRATAADVETSHNFRVDLVVVGDAALDDGANALVRAAREALVNAAKHSGADRADVYAEIGAAAATVFVRDRGRGFDPGAVAEDRMGLRGSIVERMRRHGGETEIRSAPDAGTEIRLRMPIGPQERSEQ